METLLPVPSPDERCAEVRLMVARRGWTAELEAIASLRVAVAMEAAGLKSFRPEKRENAIPGLCVSC